MNNTHIVVKHSDGQEKYLSVKGFWTTDISQAQIMPKLEACEYAFRESTKRKPAFARRVVA